MGIGSVYLWVLVLAICLLPAWLVLAALLRWWDARHARKRPHTAPMMRSPAAPLPAADRARVFSEAEDMARRWGGQ